MMILKILNNGIAQAPTNQNGPRPQTTGTGLRLNISSSSKHCFPKVLPKEFYLMSYLTELVRNGQCWNLIFEG